MSIHAFPIDEALVEARRRLNAALARITIERGTAPTIEQVDVVLCESGRDVLLHAYEGDGCIMVSVPLPAGRTFTDDDELQWSAELQ